MPLPETIPIKISSEAAGYVSMTPVARQELPLVELVERILAITGKDVVRIRKLLSRGSLVSGSSRYRWPALEVSEDDLGSLLARFPDQARRSRHDQATASHAALGLLKLGRVDGEHADACLSLLKTLRASPVGHPE